MNYQFSPYLVIVLLSSLLTIGLSYFGFKYRKIRGGKVFAVTMLLLSLWSLSNIMELSATKLSVKLFWANMQYIAYALSPVAGLMLISQFVGKYNLLTRKNVILLAIIPLITIILAWTNSYHGLIRQNISLANNNLLSTIEKDYGSWFLVHSFYSYSLQGLAIIFIVSSFWTQPSNYRKQTVPLLVAQVLSLLPSLLYVVGLSPIVSYDLTPSFFGITGLVFAYGIFFNSFFEMIPIARETIIEKISSGIIVVDIQNRILDINLKATELLGCNKKKSIEKNLTDISTKLSTTIKVMIEKNLNRKEISYRQKYFYEINLTPLKDYRNDLVARVILINDITEEKLVQNQLLKQQSEIATMKERERMARDLHDNLGQILSFISIQAQAINHEIDKDNQALAKEYLTKLIKITQEAHQDVREYVYKIRNNPCHERPILKILLEIIEDFKNTSEIKTIVDIPDKINDIISKVESKNHLSNILKEALNNIIKHSNATLVTISFEIKEDNYQLIIEDNGEGFDISKHNHSSGLNIMKERASLLDGRLEVESKLEEGTKVTVTG